jgi:hypothetical protein
VRRPAIAAALCVACGARTELDAAAATDAGRDAGIDAPVEARADVGVDVGVDAPAVCDYGTIVSDVFGATVFWAGGAALPPGHYRVTYVDGCMKYSSSQQWTVNAYPDGPDTLYVVADGGAPVAPAPGTVGFLQGQGGFATFDECVSGNLSQDAALELDWPGGPLGLKLLDDPYSDNVAGDSGRNPAYRLSSCP